MLAAMLPAYKISRQLAEFHDSWQNLMPADSVLSPMAIINQSPKSLLKRFSEDYIRVYGVAKSHMTGAVKCQRYKKRRNCGDIKAKPRTDLYDFCNPFLGHLHLGRSGQK